MDLPVKVKLAIAAMHVISVDVLHVGETSSLVDDLSCEGKTFTFSLNGTKIEVDTNEKNMLIGHEVIIHTDEETPWLGEVRLLSYGDPHVYMTIGRLEVHQKGVTFIESSSHNPLIVAIQISKQDPYTPTRLKVNAFTSSTSPVCSHCKDGVHFRKEVILGICKALEHVGIKELTDIQGVDARTKGFLTGKTKDRRVVSIYTTIDNDTTHIELNAPKEKRYSCCVYMDVDDDVWITEDKESLKPTELHRFKLNYDIYFDVTNKISRSFGISGNAIYL